MPPAQLPDAPEALAKAWREGRPYRADRSVEIDAAVIRALLTGTHPGGAPAPGTARIAGVTITGTLDLENVRGRKDGGTISCFEAVDCAFEQPLYLSFAAIDGLLLIECDLPGLDLRGARVDGELNLSGSHIDASKGQTTPPVALMGDGASIRCDVRLRPNGERRFKSEGPVSFRLARIGGNFSANGAEMKNSAATALDCDGAEITGGVSLSTEGAHRFEASGGVRFAGAKLASFSAEGARLDNSGTKAALDCEGAVIAGEVQLREVGNVLFETDRHISFIGAEIGELDLTGAQIGESDGAAVRGDRLMVKGAVFLSQAGRPPTLFKGDINLPGASIGGELSLNNGTIHGTLSLVDAAIDGSLYLRDVVTEPPPTSGKPVCFEFSGVEIKGSLTLAGITRPDGARPQGLYQFEGASVDRLVYDPNTAWPKPGLLSLEGFTYRCIDVGGHEGKSGSKRTAWLDLQFERPNDRGHFSPQPYEHLAKVLRDEGRDREADTVARRKRDLAIDRSDAGFIEKLPARFMGCVGHGYSRPRAFWLAAGWWGLGIVWLWLAIGFHMASFERVHPTPRPQVTAFFAPGFDDGRFDRFDLDGRYTDWQQDGCPGVVIPVYALELMLPIADLGQDSDCRMESHEAGKIVFWGGALQVWRAVYQIVGAILVAVLGVALTGLIRKD